MSSRSEQIKSILERVEEFKKNRKYAKDQYALDANIAFLKAARSLPKYFKWLFSVAPKLDGSRLLELTDYPVEEWDIAMHERLIALQKQKFPGIIVPLVTFIIDYIEKQSRDLVIADLGSGGMEVDRQVIAHALKTKFPHALTIVAVDKSPMTHKIARANLKDVLPGIELVEIENLTGESLNQLRKKAIKKILVVLCKNNIFELDKDFKLNSFDLVYHSLFKHHLTESEQRELDRVVRTIGKHHAELDGYKSWPHGVIQSLVGWSSPVFLNGTIISMARYKTRPEIGRELGEISYYTNTAHYLRAF